MYPEQPVQYLVDSDGRRRAVVLPIAVYDRLLEELEQLRDMQAMHQTIHEWEPAPAAR